MNDIDKNPNYKEIYNFICNKFLRTNHFKHGPFDETFYTMRVYESAKEIIKSIKNVNKEQVLVASLLHDIGKIKLKISKIFTRHELLDNIHEEWHKHPKLSVPIAKRFLKKLGHSKEFIDEVSYLIENHDRRGNLLKSRTIELKILQDADLIADIGISGFIRPFLFCGKFSKRSIIDSIKYIEKLKEDRTQSGKLLNLNISKKLAKEKIKNQRILDKDIINEINSDLIY